MCIFEEISQIYTLKKNAPYALLNFSFPCLHLGHFQSSGRSSKATPSCSAECWDSEKPRWGWVGFYHNHSINWKFTLNCFPILNEVDTIFHYEHLKLQFVEGVPMEGY